jgi:hypothetical protein
MRKQLAYVFILISMFTIGQELDASLSTHKAILGERIFLTYSLRTKQNDSINFHAKTDEIKTRLFVSNSLTKENGLLEIISEFKDSSFFDGQYQNWSGKYEVVAWDTGKYLIQGPSVSINGLSYSFKDLTLTVLFEQDKKGTELFDIRESFVDLPEQTVAIKVKEFAKKNWWWLIAFPIFLLIYAFNYFRKRKTKEVAPIKITSLKQRTLWAIEALENERLWEKDKLKEHFIELSFILRSYLTSRYEISLLECTTNQAKTLLIQKGLNAETVDVIVRILAMSDLIKFANSKTDELGILKTSTLAKQIVAETSPLEIEDDE